MAAFYLTRLKRLLNVEESVAVALAFLALAISSYQSFKFFLHLAQYDRSEYMSWVFLNREELICLIAASVCLGLTWFGRRKKWLVITNLIWTSISFFVIGGGIYYAFWFALTSIANDPAQRQAGLGYLRLEWEHYWYLPIVFLLLLGVWGIQWRVLYRLRQS